MGFIGVDRKLVDRQDRQDSVERTPSTFLMQLELNLQIYNYEIYITS